MFFTRWEPGSGVVVDLSGEMEGAEAAFAVVDLEAGRRVKIRLPRGAPRVSRGDRVRFRYAPEKRDKAVKELEVLARPEGDGA